MNSTQNSNVKKRNKSKLKFFLVNIKDINLTAEITKQVGKNENLAVYFVKLAYCLHKTEFEIDN